MMKYWQASYEVIRYFQDNTHPYSLACQSMQLILCGVRKQTYGWWCCLPPKSMASPTWTSSMRRWHGCKRETCWTRTDSPHMRNLSVHESCYQPNALQLDHYPPMDLHGFQCEEPQIAWKISTIQRCVHIMVVQNRSLLPPLPQNKL